MSDVMHDDASDVKRALAGEADAFARLYDRHAAVVLSLCRRSIPSGVRSGLAEADDAMQETMIRAFRSLDQLDEPDHFRRWVYGIARNVCAERRRAAMRRNKHEGDAMKAAHAMSDAGHIHRNGQIDHADDVEQLDRLGEAIDRLDEDERLAIHLFYLQEGSAAAAMNAMPGTLSRSGFYKLLSRAREKLAALMQSDSSQDATSERAV